MKLTVVQAGRMEYDRAYALQKRLVERVKAAPGVEAYLIIVEHPPVLTIGRSGDETDFLVDRDRLAREGITVREIDRGGRTTYHGPGQLVGYPIIALQDGNRDVHAFLRTLEAVLISALSGFGIEAERREGLTGVWVGPSKIAAIGVGFTRWVSFHGFALNVDPDLAHFGLIHPCGLQGIGITSMAKLLGRPVNLAEVSPTVVEGFRSRFGFDMAVEVPAEDVE